MMVKLSEIIQIIKTKPLGAALSTIFLAFLLAVIAHVIVKKLLKPLSRRTKTKIDDFVIKRLSAIIFYLIFLLGFKIALQNLLLKNHLWERMIDSLLILIICFFLLKIINDIANLWMKEWQAKTKTTTDERLIPFFQKILKSIVIILAIIFIFNAWQINISPLLATAGIAGLAIGLAVKDSLNNIMGGLQLVLDRTFKVGDKIELDSKEMGIILDIGLRSTKLQTYDNEIIYIPNGYLANAKIKNFTQPDLSVRVNVNFSIEFGTDPEKVKNVVLQILKKVEKIIDTPPPVVELLEMGDSALKFVARAWVNHYADAYEVKLSMTEAIYQALNKAGIIIPFPTHTIYNIPSKKKA